MLNTIDHIIITVEDLPSAIEDYSKVLGFKPTWRGEHPEMGTENALFPLQNTYLELMAAKGNGLYADIVKTNLEKKGEGLFGLVLGTNNLEVFKKNLTENGIETGDIVEGKGFEPKLNIINTANELITINKLALVKDKSTSPIFISGPILYTLNWYIGFDAIFVL